MLSRRMELGITINRNNYSDNDIHSSVARYRLFRDINAAPCMVQIPSFGHETVVTYPGRRLCAAQKTCLSPPRPSTRSKETEFIIFEVGFATKYVGE